MHPEDQNNNPEHKTATYLTDAAFYLAILFFIIGFNFSDRMAGNWYQQFMPSIGGRAITDVFFLDSLTGWSVTNATNQVTDTTYVLKTTNGGDNWAIQYSKMQTGGGFSGYFKVYFLNQSTGYTCDVRGIYKTTDGGTNWTSLNAPLNAYVDMSILDTDTIWIVSTNSLTGGVFRTTNSGASWQNQLNLGSQNPGKVYFFDRNLGFVSQTTGQILYRTTNSGVNWSTLSTAGAFGDMYFANNLTGWKSGAPGGPGFRKTNDGGLNWVDQILPNGGNISYSQIEKISGLNKDTIWGVRAFLLTTSGFRGMIHRTTNGGDNWLFQVPDSTVIQIGQYDYIDFVNKVNGWAYRDSPTGIHTTTGGDPIWLTPVNQISSEVPKEFMLFNNYPNPFNAMTKIKFQISKAGLVQIKLFDLTGKEKGIVMNGNLIAGTYETTFDANNYSSGVYFYSLIFDSRLIKTNKMILIK